MDGQTARVKPLPHVGFMRLVAFILEKLLVELLVEVLVELLLRLLTFALFALLVPFVVLVDSVFDSIQHITRKNETHLTCFFDIFLTRSV